MEVNATQYLGKSNDLGALLLFFIQWKFIDQNTLVGNSKEKLFSGFILLKVLLQSSIDCVGRPLHLRVGDRIQPYCPQGAENL
jgi:hypothetical protein